MLLLLLLMLLLMLMDVTSSEVFDLSDLSWTVRGGENESISAEARLPGSVYTDLQTAGILGSLYYRFNDVEYRWVSTHNWTYSTLISLSQEQLQSRLIQLDCHGLDTVATILINDQEVASTNNMFVRFTERTNTLQSS